MPLCPSHLSTNGSGTSASMIQFGATQPYMLMVKMSLGGCTIPLSKRAFEQSYNLIAVVKRVSTWSPRQRDSLDGLQIDSTYSTKHGMSQQVCTKLTIGHMY